MSGEDCSSADGAERARLQKALRESLILRELADILNSSLDLEHILHALVKRTTELCEVERCAVWLRDDNLSSFRPITYYVNPAALTEEVIQKGEAIWYRMLLPIDNPVNRRLLESDGVLYVEDLRTETLLQTLTGIFRTYSVLLVSLARDGNLFGFLSLDNPGRVGVFSPEQHQLARAIGQQATIAIHNARLYQHAQTQQLRAEHLIERARATYQVAMAVNSGADLPTVLGLATQHLVRVLDAYTGVTLLLDDDEVALYPADQQDEDHTLPAMKLSLEQLPHFCTAINTGRSVLIHVDQVEGEEVTWFRQFGLKSMLIVPLMVGANHQGTNWELPSEQKSLVPSGDEVEALVDAHCVGLIVVSYVKRKKPTSGQSAFARDIAAQCGLAIEKARLLTATIHAEQRVRTALNTLLHTAEAVSYSTEIRSILQGVLAETLAALNCPRGAVYVFKPDEQRFELLYALGFTSEEEVYWLEEQQTWLRPADGQIFDVYQQVMHGHAILVGAEHRPVQSPLFEQTMILAAPITHNQHMLGLLLLDRSRAASPEQALCTFTRWDLTIAEGIAQLAGVAMEQVHWQQEAITARAEAITAKANEEAMREVDALKNDLLAMTAHEFRSPLAIIQGHSQVALRSLRKAGKSKTLLPSDFEEPLTVIEAQAKQLNSIVATFLDAASLNRGQIRLHMKTVHLDKIVRQVVEDQANLVEHRAVRCLVYPAEIPYIVQGDAERLAQIITNLVENAIKYSPPDSPVTVALSQVQTSTSFEVCVADRGIGIPPEAQSRLFERFYRVPDSAGRTRGVGLGLYIVAQLVHMHQGHIRVESSGVPGDGSRFILTLPALPQPPEDI